MLQRSTCKQGYEEELKAQESKQENKLCQHNGQCSTQEEIV